MNESKVNVLEVMDNTANFARCDNSWNSMDEAEFKDAKTVLVDLINASKRTIRAFEALGNASSIVPTKLARMECESAMVALKASLARIGSAS